MDVGALPEQNQTDQTVLWYVLREFITDTMKDDGENDDMVGVVSRTLADKFVYG